MKCENGLIVHWNIFTKEFIFCRSVAVAFFLIMMCTSVPVFSQTASRILMLGSARGELSEIEDRIIREEVMRQLVKSGRKIVPVMEIEKEIQENALDIRQISDSEMKSISVKLNADMIARGSFLRKPASFSFLLSVWNMKTGDIARKEIPLDIKGAPGDYWQKLANGIVLEILSATDPRVKKDQSDR